MKKYGIIGGGGRAQGLIPIINKFDLGVKLTCITDPNPEYVKNVARFYNNNFDDVKMYADAKQMLENEKLDGVMISTRCSLHTELALLALSYDLPIYLEKPIATNEADLARLKRVVDKYDKRVVVSFPLRLTAPVQYAKEIIDSGRIGTVEHVQAVNNVTYGGVYYHNWYRDEQETGGLFLQKATHDIDYINYLLGYKATSVCAVNSKQIFKGNKPAGVKCVDCAERLTCSESDFTMKHIKYDDVVGDYCCFSTDVGNEDSGSVIIHYDTGMHAVYSQSFYVRQGAGKRGARLIGYKGTIEFDWITDTMKVFMHDQPRTETIEFDTTKMSHGGGDDKLALNFINLMMGIEDSKSTLRDGINSVEICLAAKKSAQTRTFRDVNII